MLRLPAIRKKKWPNWNWKMPDPITYYTIEGALPNEVQMSVTTLYESVFATRKGRVIVLEKQL